MTWSLALFNIHGFVLSWMEDDRIKKTTKIIREIEQAQAKIAVLREEHARTSQELSYWVGTHKNKVMELVGATVERLDLSHVPIHNLLSSLTRLGEDAVHDGTDATLMEEADTDVFVKIGRNASSSNRRALEMARLHWHGRQAGWVGVVTAAQLAELRRTFGGRVEKPEQVGAEEDPGEPQEDAPEAVSADVEAIATPACEEPTPSKLPLVKHSSPEESGSETTRRHHPDFPPISVRCALPQWFARSTGPYPCLPPCW